MKRLIKELELAKKSPLRMWWFNRVMWLAIPFNSPHRLRIDSVTDDEVRVSIPFRKHNLNHLKSLHACVMATAAEYASGLVLLQQADAGTYRLIMQKMEVEYNYQGRKAAYSKALLSKETVEREIVRPLEDGAESVVYKCLSEVFDTDDRLLCTAHIFWQVKPWSKVRSKQQA